MLSTSADDRVFYANLGGWARCCLATMDGVRSLPGPNPVKSIFHIDELDNAIIRVALRANLIGNRYARQVSVQRGTDPRCAGRKRSETGFRARGLVRGGFLSALARALAFGSVNAHRPTSRLNQSVRGRGPQDLTLPQPVPSEMVPNWWGR